MATTTKHSALAGVDMHTIVRWVVADVAGLPTAVTAEDVHKVAYVTDTKTYYGLVAHSPVEWRAFGHADNPVVSVTEAGGVLTITQRDGTESTITLPTGGGDPLPPSTDVLFPRRAGLNMLYPPESMKTRTQWAGGHEIMPSCLTLPSSAYVYLNLYSGGAQSVGKAVLKGVAVKYSTPNDKPFPVKVHSILKEYWSAGETTDWIDLDPTRIIVALDGAKVSPIEGSSPDPTWNESTYDPVFNEATQRWEWPDIEDEGPYPVFLLARDVRYAIISGVRLEVEFPDHTMAAAADIAADLVADTSGSWQGFSTTDASPAELVDNFSDMYEAPAISPSSGKAVFVEFSKDIIVP